MYTSHIWLTNQCNLKCKYCYVEKDFGCVRMDYKTIQKTIEFIAYNVRNLNEEKLKIHFHGGEPLLELGGIKKIVDCVKEDSILKKCDVTYSVTTNGILVDASHIDFICDTFNQLSISLDGAKYSHDMYRVGKDGRGTFDQVVEVTKKLLKKKPMLRIRMTVNPDTVDRLFDNVHFIIKIGGKYISPCLNFGHPSWTEKHFLMFEEELKKISEYLFRLNDSSIDVGMIVDGKTVLNKKGKCGAGLNVVSIYADGDIYPCLLTTPNKDFKIGTLEKGIQTKLVEDILILNNHINTCCRGCDLYSYCKNTRCKVINKQETGNYLLPLSARCWAENVIYRIMKYNYLLRK